MQNKTKDIYQEDSGKEMEDSKPAAKTTHPHNENEYMSIPNQESRATTYTNGGPHQKEHHNTPPTTNHHTKNIPTLLNHSRMRKKKNTNATTIAQTKNMRTKQKQNQQRNHQGKNQAPQQETIHSHSSKEFREK